MKVTRLRIERVKRGLSQRDLSRLTNIPNYKLSMYENGILKLKDGELKRLKEVLRTEIVNPEFF